MLRDILKPTATTHPATSSPDLEASMLDRLPPNEAAALTPNSAVAVMSRAVFHIVHYLSGPPWGAAIW
jgi:hypothetical protein